VPSGLPFDAYAAWLRGLLADGVLIVAGPCLGQVNTGIAIFEASDEQTARRIVAEEPVTSGGYMRGDLRPYRLGCCAAATGSRREAGMTVGLVALPCPRPGHRDELICRVRRAAEAMAAAPGCLAVDCWMSGDHQAVVTTGQWESGTGAEGRVCGRAGGRR